MKDEAQLRAVLEERLEGALERTGKNRERADTATRWLR